MNALAAAAVVVAATALAQSPAAIAPFSRAAPGRTLPAPWQPTFIRGIEPAQIELVQDEGITVLRIRASAAAGSATHRLDAHEGATPVLSWRWKVDRSLEKATWGTRAGDDYAARVYVAFDLPLEALPFLERAKIRFARFMYGEDVPAAAICYVWAGSVAPGTSGWNPYAPRVWMIVLRAGDERARQWVEESRDVAVDFRAAFASIWTGPVPRIAGVAASTDTDQTLESATAWFGDFRLR